MEGGTAQVEDQANRKPSDIPADSDPKVYFWPVGDFVGAIAFIAVAVFFIVEALRMPHQGSSGFVTSAGFTPVFLGLIVLFLNAAMIRLILRTYGYRSIRGWARTVTSDETFRRWLSLAAIIGGYVSLVGHVHFVIANALFFAVIFTFLKAGNWWQILLYTGLSAAIVGYFVPWMFAMPMP